MERITNIYFSNHLLNKCVISACLICVSEWKKARTCISLFVSDSYQEALIRVMQSNKGWDSALTKGILALNKGPLRRARSFP